MPNLPGIVIWAEENNKAVSGKSKTDRSSLNIYLLVGRFQIFQYYSYEMALPTGRERGSISEILDYYALIYTATYKQHI
jgi:hypothetical protein